MGSVDPCPPLPTPLLISVPSSVLWVERVSLTASSHPLPTAPQQLTCGSWGPRAGLSLLPSRRFPPVFILLACDSSSQTVFPSEYASCNPGDSDGKDSTCSAGGRPRFNPWVRKIPWRRGWLPIQYSCLENPMDRGAWWATVRGVAKIQKRLSD